MAKFLKHIRPHPLPVWEYLLWFTLLGLAAYGYFRIYNIHRGSDVRMAFLVGTHLLYFLLAVFIVLPLVFRQKGGRQVLLLGLFLILLTLLTMAGWLTAGVLMHTVVLDMDFSKDFIFEVGFFFTTLWPYAELGNIWALAFYLRTKEQAGKLENKRMQEELEQQQATLLHLEAQWYDRQLDPHLLKNLMSTYRSMIYTASREDQEKALNCLIAIARFYVWHADATKPIPLREEIKHLEHLLALYRLASGKRVYLRVIFPRRKDGLYILPALLLTLVKNMHKHGLLHSRNHPARLQVSTENGVLQIEASNYINPDASTETPEEKTGAGMRILEGKLRSRHPGASLDVSKEAGQFIVRIRIPLLTLIPKS